MSVYRWRQEKSLAGIQLAPLADWRGSPAAPRSRLERPAAAPTPQTPYVRQAPSSMRTTSDGKYRRLSVWSSGKYRSPKSRQRRNSAPHLQPEPARAEPRPWLVGSERLPPPFRRLACIGFEPQSPLLRRPSKLLRWRRAERALPHPHRTPDSHCRSLADARP